MKCFYSLPDKNPTRKEQWFTEDHIHDTTAIEYDAPFFIGEMLPKRGYNYLVDPNNYI